MQAGITEPVQTEAATSREVETQKRRLHEQCREFESVMVSYLMKTMRDGTIRAEEPDHARETYEEMFAGHVAKHVAGTGTLGIGDMLYAKLEPTIKAKTAQTSVPGNPLQETVSTADSTAAADAMLNALDITLK